MATATKTKKKPTKKPSTRQDLIQAYMESVLETEKYPVSVFKFCKDQKINEATFYALFGSFKSLQRQVWVEFFDQTVNLIEKSPEYASMAPREKLLTLYYTLFELLAANRSYVLFTLDAQRGIFDVLGDLISLAPRFKEYVLRQNSLVEDESIHVRHISSNAVEELAWAQFLVILKFWINDDSPGFEKTDIMIEKTVNTSYDLVDTRPVRNLVDLAKFIIIEGIQRP